MLQTEILKHFLDVLAYFHGFDNLLVALKEVVSTHRARANQSLPWRLETDSHILIIIS